MSKGKSSKVKLLRIPGLAISESAFKKLEEKAAAEGKTLHEVARRILENALKRKK